MKLLALVHNRSQAQLGDWMLFDIEQFQLGFHSGLLNFAFNPHCMVAIGENFGKLVPWNKATAHRWDSIGYPAARMALRAQVKISDFLQKMVACLLPQESKDTTGGRDQWDVMAKASFRTTNSLIAESAFHTQPFSTAPGFDIGVIYSIVKARYDAAADELEQMQTNPEYLRYTLDEKSKSLRSVKDEDIRQLELYMAPLTPYKRCYVWSLLVAKVRHFVNVWNEFCDDMRVGRPPPMKYQQELMRLDGILRTEQAGCMASGATTDYLKESSVPGLEITSPGVSLENRSCPRRHVPDRPSILEPHRA